MPKKAAIALMLLTPLLLGACGGSTNASGNTNKTDPVKETQNKYDVLSNAHRVSDKNSAAAFLTRSTFGPTTKSINQLVKKKTYEQWLAEQLTLTPSYHLPKVNQRATKMCANLDDDGTKLKDSWEFIYPRLQIWWETALHAPDQLRQRMAFALSEIMVISDSDGLGLSDYQKAVTSYYDVLVKHSLGNYRDLLEEVTLHPAMGDFLSMSRNQKANKKQNIRPDENYAREILQLFSIGVHQLNLDGTEKLDTSGKPIPTYDQQTIEDFAKVFTGWNYADLKWQQYAGNADKTRPLVAVEKYHDTTTKTLLNGVKSPAGQTAKADLSFALDNIFKHPNVAPFISKLLIQRLVTSNPSPNYVRRVAQMFNNNGKGVRGDLGSVASAILLDKEALAKNKPANFGKLREPLLRLSHLWRAFNMQATLKKGHRWQPEKTCGQGTYPYYSFWTSMNDFKNKVGQGPLQAKSVFNFFTSDFSPAGAINEAGLTAPEFQIMNENTTVGASNLIHTLITRFSDSKAMSAALLNEKGKKQRSKLNLSTEAGLAKNTDALLEHLNLVLLNGEMSQPLKQIVSEHLNKKGIFHNDERQGLEKAREAILLISSSPEYLNQK